MANEKHSHFLDDVDWNNVRFAYKTGDELAAEKTALSNNIVKKD